MEKQIQLNMIQFRTTAEVLVVVALMASMGVNITNDGSYSPYACDESNVQDMMCYKLSKVNDDGIQRNCYYNKDAHSKYKVCSSGWNSVVTIGDDVCPDVKVQIVALTDNGKYFCDGIGQDVNCVKNEDISMPFNVI